MLFVVFCLDRPGASGRRLEAIDKHKQFVKSGAHDIRVLISGPLVSEFDSRMKGSFFLVEAESRAQVDTWQADDPYFLAEVWGQRFIEAFDMKTDALSSTPRSRQLPMTTKDG